MWTSLTRRLAKQTKMIERHVARPAVGKPPRLKMSTELGDRQSDRLAELLRRIQRWLGNPSTTCCDRCPFAPGDRRTLPCVSDDYNLPGITGLLPQFSPGCLQGGFVSVHVPAGDFVQKAIRSWSVLASKNHVLRVVKATMATASGATSRSQSTSAPFGMR
jgi:hypothetical protein